MDKKKRVAVFLDRDGVINDVVDRGDDFSVKGKKVKMTAPYKYDEFHIKEGVREALEKIKALGFLLILASNQPDIKYGLMTEEDNKEIMEEIKKLPLDDIFICYHGRDDNCPCKKPKPGMLLAAQEKWDIDLSSSCMIGDTANDMMAGWAAGCKTILIDCFYNRDIQSDFRVQNLLEAACLIRSFSEKKRRNLMKLFVDSANLKDIEEALDRGFSGITTNPSLLAKEPKSEFEKHIGKIVDLILKYNPLAHLSVEVFSRDAEEILNQARNFKKNFGLQGLSVKVQIGWDELRAINALFKEGISVNCTCNMSVVQALLAATAGAEFISFFWGRIRDGKERKHARERDDLIRRKVLTREDFNPYSVVHEARALFDRSYPNAKIIAGSMRSVSDIVDAGLAGAHIVTVPPKFFKDMISHFKTDEVVEQFFVDFKEWLN